MNKKTLKRVRITLASICFALITLMFLDFTGTLHHYLSWLAKIQFFPAVMALNFTVIALLVVLTLIFGRIYCSVICPLGIYQDLVQKIHSAREKNRYNFSKGLPILRYIFLGIFIIAIIFGASSLVALLAPYSSYGRIAQNLFQPLYIWVNNLFALVAEHFNSYAFYSKEVWIRSLPTFIIAVVCFLVITVMAWVGGRTYCNTICPVGTVLGFLSRFSWLKINIDESKCVKCDICTKNCKTKCIDGKNNVIDHSRCVSCGDCMAKCPKEAINYSHAKTKNTESKIKQESTETKKEVDNSKRAFLFTSLAVGSSVAFAQEKGKVDGGLAIIEDKVTPQRATKIVPSGAKSIKNFEKRCTACQLCVSKCPNDVLRPSTSLMNMMQPEMSYERGYCRPECTACSEVCPTDAIERIDKAEKSSIKIGTAHWIKKNCIPLTDGVECGNCAKHCPSGAILMVNSIPGDEESVKIPTINEERCIGCGACENLCPSRPFSAIYVEGIENHRTI